MLSTNSDSVYYLVGELCKCFRQEYSPHKLTNITSARKQKSRCYEILLNKSLDYPINSSNTTDPLRDLDIHLFELRIKSKNDYNKEKECENFEKYLQYILEEPYFQENEGQNILSFLLNLQGSLEEYVANKDNIFKSNLLIPGPFTLHASPTKNAHYPQKSFQISKPATDTFGELQRLQDDKNPYLPRFLFQEESNKLLKIHQKYGLSTRGTVTVFSGVVRDTWGSALCLNPFACKFFTNISRVTTCFSINPLHDKKSLVKTSHVKLVKKTDAISDDNKTFSWNWENLGTYKIPLSSSFSSESNSSLHLNSILHEHSTKPFSAKVMKLSDFIVDLKSLTIGIQSDTFSLDEFAIFHMLPDITIAGVSPSVIETFASDFLECGTCYKRLQIMTIKQNYKLMYDGFIYKALCSALEEYLVIFRNFVISFNCLTLPELRCKLKDMMKQIVALAHTLSIHPSIETGVKLPTGSQFLGFLYREITQVTQKDIVMLLVYLLKRCCSVYFKHLQKWIFYGVLDDPCNELFICFVDHYRSYTKYFFDKAYHVSRESVPGFFQGFEDQILQCGKYAMLLKAFKPNYPLFDIEYPSISVCLSFEEVQTVAENCRKYAEKAHEICGKPITCADVFHKRREKKNEFFRMVSEKCKKNMEIWTAEQEGKAALRVAEKKKRLEEIHAQLQEVKERKIAEKKSNLQLELKLLKEGEEVEKKRLLQENLNIQKRLEYYQELGAIMEERKQRAEKDIAKANSAVDGFPETPVSSHTDFESCCGEDDPESGYEDCVSVGFMEKFKQSEEDLFKIVRTDNSEKEEVYNIGNGETDCAERDSINIKRMPKSESDYFNSNEVEPDSNVISELEQNRNKVLGSHLEGCFSQTQTKVDTSKPLTEAQKIKLKVLMHEFGYQICDNASGKSDINSNSASTEVEQFESKSTLSDLQKNRQKMMQNDIFAAFNNKENERKTLNLDFNLERSRNRRRVLESEFHILTGESSSAVQTPMSTTSDSCSIDDRLEDDANCIKNISNLKVDIEVAKSLDVAKMQLDVPTAVVEETPECALNTAGLIARNRFDFYDRNISDETQKESSADTTDFPMDLQVETCFQPSTEVSCSYKRCEELLNSNFKCEPRNPLFSIKSKQPEGNATSVQAIEVRRRLLNNLSAITLTEFLQKSVTIPLCTHLEIMNNEVMRIFLDDLDIIGHFKSLRNYFFLMDGEFGSFICDGLIARLEKGATPNELLNYQMLHSILDNALGSSIIGNDKNAENLSFIVMDVPEKFDLNSPTVLDNLSLSYRVTWPVNLILNPETLEQYSNIFKYLMKVRRVSWLLEESYQMLKEIVKKHGKEILFSPQYRRVQQIRQKFFHFVHALRNHITSSALQASWKTFKDDLLSAKTMEDLYRKHTTYIKKILFLCMLNKRSTEFYNTIENIFKVSLKFYRNLKSREWKKLPGNEHFTHSRYERLLNDEAEFEKLIKYTIYLGNKIVRHGYQEEIGEFISFINYNNYYVVDG